MSYIYHGATGLIPLSGEVQRIVDRGVIVIEKDFAVRKDRLPDALQNLAPGKTIPGTRYIIDAQPQIQFESSGFARIRLSALDIDFTGDEANITQGSAGWSQQLAANSIAVSVNFTYALGTFRYRRSIFSDQQNPIFPDPIEPTLLNSNLQSISVVGQPISGFQTTFGPARWIGLGVTRVNLYENRAFEYTAQAVCAPSFVRLSSNEAAVQYSLGFGFSQTVVQEIAGAGQNSAHYFGPTALFGPAISQAQRIEQIQSDLLEAEAAFDSAWRGISNVNGVRDANYVAILQRRIELLRSELRKETQQ